MEDCLFCRIGRREIAVKAVAVSDSGVAFLDINPVAPGHTVVIPKKHHATIIDMSDGDIGLLFALARQAAAQIKAGLKCDGFNIGINQDKAGGQAIPHVHVHIIPRFTGDGGGSMHSIVRNPPKETIDEIYRKVSGAPAQEREETAEKEKPAPEKEDIDPVKRLQREWELDL